MELVSLFLFFLLFGALFSPFFGGCLILFFILFTLGAFVVFFSLNFIWFLLAGLILYSVGFGIKIYKWYKLPDYAAYINKYPHCKLENKIVCHSCGSENIINTGLFHKQSKFRYYICSACGATLFRFKVL